MSKETGTETSSYRGQKWSTSLFLTGTTQQTGLMLSSPEEQLCVSCFLGKSYSVHTRTAKYKELMAIMRQKISTDIHHVWRKLKNLVGQMVMTTRDRGSNVYCNQHKNHYLYFLCNTYITAKNKPHAPHCNILVTTCTPGKSGKCH